MRTFFPETERLKIHEKGQEQLFDADGKEALDYLKSVRLFTDKVIREANLGYMPKGVRNCLGFPHELSGKIIMPIINQYGELVALSGRDWRKDAKMPFWHESFSKSNYLYGLNVAKDHIIKNKKVIVVEGQFDAVKLWQFGMYCSVAILGSAPQIHQIALLSRYCKNMYIVFDGDEAGIAATERMNEISRNNNIPFFGINLIPVILPDRLDPDDFIKSRGTKKFINILKQAKEIFFERKEKE